MSFPTDLLNQARKLASADPRRPRQATTPGDRARRPRQATVRRAVSTAYYALFHFIGEESAKMLIGATNQDKMRRDLALRAIAHTKLKDVCKEFLKPVPKPVLQPFWGPAAIAGDANIATICSAIIDLQELRHTADYDLQSPIRKSDALDACDTVESATNAWTHLRQTKPDAAALFATSVLLWPGLSGR